MNSKSQASILKTTTYSGEKIINIWNFIRTAQYNSVNFFDEYIVTDYDRWDSISNRFYQTPHFWWMLANYNKVKDPFSELVPGTTLRVIKKEVLISVVQKLKGIVN